MSLVLNMVGGGGGGSLKDTDAILTVTVPTGSTVTMTKGGVTLTPTMWVQAADPTLDCALFVIAPSLFDAVNAWTVTSSLSGVSTSATITINSNQQYELILSERCIVKNGVIVDSGATTFGNITATEQAGGYVLAKNTGNNTGGFKSSQIDFSLYSKIVLELVLVNNVYGQSWRGTGVPAVGYGTIFNLSGDDVTGFVGLTYLRSSTGTITNTAVFEVDISQIILSYSVACTCGGSSSIPGGIGYLNIKNLYLK